MGRSATKRDGVRMRKAPAPEGDPPPSEDAAGPSDPGAGAVADLFAEAPPPGVSPAGPGVRHVCIRESDAVQTRGAPESDAGRTAGARKSDARRTKAARPADAAAGHRERLRARFMRAGPEALDDYELLELVLFRAIPRQDVKPLAKRLLSAFGDFNHVLAAPPARLAEVQGASTAVVRELKIVAAAAHRFAQAKVLGRDAIQSWNQLVEYCTTRLAHEDIEQFRILFLDRKNILIADEAQSRGTVDHVPVYPREVVKRALELGASALVLVHNHPSGDPSPSRADVDMTRRIEAACRAVGLALHDHVVVGKGEVASFHALGLLDE